jgi:hypothetical protein
MQMGDDAEAKARYLAALKAKPALDTALNLCVSSGVSSPGWYGQRKVYNSPIGRMENLWVTHFGAQKGSPVLTS